MTNDDLLPTHIAVIMDGNGRWAQARGLDHLEGHRAGADALRRVITECTELNIPYLSAFAFSTENWRRSSREVEGLMRLMVEFAEKEAEELKQNGVRVVPIGDLSGLPRDSAEALRALRQYTGGSERLTLLLAVNYGGRADISRAAAIIARRAAQGELDPNQVDAGVVSQHLYTHPFPDPDLVIRTGGEMRLSNFMLFQAAYAEFISSKVLWPDFRAADLRRALRTYRRRERRFGTRTQTQKEG